MHGETVKIHYEFSNTFQYLNTLQYVHVYFPFITTKLNALSFIDQISLYCADVYREPDSV